MRIRRFAVNHFRGLSDLTIIPQGHVILMGEPGSGRSDVLDALGRLLDPSPSRSASVSELDFYQRNTLQPIEISAVIGELGADLEQHFLDHLEVWNTRTHELIDDADSLEEFAGAGEWVLRLTYRCEWVQDEERFEDWSYYPKQSDVTLRSYTRVRATDFDRLDFTTIQWTSGRILDLGVRSPFRRVVSRSAGGDFADALANYVESVGIAAAKFTDAAQIKAALSEVFSSLVQHSRFGEEFWKLIQFAPEGGFPSGLLRSLGPSADMGEGFGQFPLWRQGSTTITLLRFAEALTLSESSDNIIAVDDLGDGIDAGSAVHMASVIRRFVGQAWISTRVAAVAEIFEPEEIFRLGLAQDGTRFARQGRPPANRDEAKASKHWHRNLLPALTYRAVLVVEGPDDLASLHTLSLKLCNEANDRLPASFGMTIISAGATGGGGYSSVLRLTLLASEMGLKAIGLVDGDIQPEARQFIADHVGNADAVIRLPDNAAIEYALVSGAPDATLRRTLRTVAQFANLPAPPGLEELAGKSLETCAIGFIKRYSLHAAFIDALPLDDGLILGRVILEKAAEAATGNLAGLVQL